MNARVSNGLCSTLSTVPVSCNASTTESRGIPSSLFGREDTLRTKSGSLLIDPWCSVVSDANNSLRSDWTLGAIAGSDLPWIRLSLRAIEFQEMLRANFARNTGLRSTSRSAPIACNAGTISLEGRPPACSTDHLSAYCLSAPAQCSVVIRGSTQITVLVSTRILEADQGQRTWVLRMNAN